MTATANSAEAANQSATANAGEAAANVTILEQGRVGGIGDIGRGAGKAAAGAAAPGVTRQSDIVAWWKMNETSGTTAADSIGSATLTLTAKPPAPDVLPVWVTGKDGNGLDFDGSDDYAANTSSGPTVTGDCSVVFWIRASPMYRLEVL